MTDDIKEGQRAAAAAGNKDFAKQLLEAPEQG
jgi:hypothetical protein